MKKLCFILPVLIWFSCSVQKRHYQKGYTVSWHSQGKPVKKEKPKTPASVAVEDHNPESNQTATQKTINYPELVPGSGYVKLKQSIKQQLPEDSCDVLVFKDGSEVRVKIIEIANSQVKYSKCSMPGGPLFISNKKEIFMVKYTNGTREVFKTEEVTTPPSTSYAPNPYRRPPKKNTKLATLSLIFGILGLYPVILIGGVAAIIMSVIQLNNISAYPDAYGGEVKAKVGLGLGIAAVVLWVMIIALIILTI